MQTIKRLFGFQEVYDSLEEHEELVEEIENNIKEIMTLDGEGKWLLKKVEDIDDCFNECSETFKGGDGG